MRGGRTAGRVVLAVALVAVPLLGLTLLAADGPTAPAASELSLLRVVPGQGGDAQAVRSGSEADPGVRGAAGARDLGLLAVLLGAAAALALRGGGRSFDGAFAGVRTGRLVPAAGRGPPALLHR